MEKEAAKEFFISCGIDKRRAEETLKNAKLLEALTAVLTQAKDEPDCNMKEVVNLLYTVASTLSPAAVGGHRPVLVKYVCSGKIGKINITAAIDYFKKLGTDPLDINNFETECGVGVVVTPEDINKAVEEIIAEKKEELLEQRYRFPVNVLMATLREKVKWANPKDLKDTMDAQLLALLGPKEKDDGVKKKKEPKKEVPKAEDAKKEVEEFKELITFPDPKENKQKRPELLKAHLEATGGRVFCRFPPEPNGFLHIGHAKACNLNFSYPKKSGGITYLRFDDTNPEAEKIEYIESIISDVEWLGHTPAKVTYSSDYFEELYQLAIKLIKADKAYVCHQVPEDIVTYREKKLNSPWRDRPIEESLREFENMRKGKYAEGEATLRMKMDMQSDNPCLRDLIAYRIKYAPHPHVGDKWCIYPSYDYTHCIIDSLENITHSLCTLEFEVRRESYYRLLDDLDLYKPLVWEYSRLNLSHTVLSKRRLIKLVQGGYVMGWDDPRLPTVRGFRRRGFTPEAINDFCDKIGITRAANMQSLALLEGCVREDLNVKCNRVLAVTEPLRVVISNWEGEVRLIDAPNHPKDPSKGSRKVPISKILYIEKSDFRMEDSKGYKRLAPGKTVGLLHAGCTLTCETVKTDAEGKPSELTAKISWDVKEKIKGLGYINWVAQPEEGKEPHAVELRLFDPLFSVEDPGSLSDWLDHLNPNSLIVLKNAFVEPHVAATYSKPGDTVQFERMGFFCIDTESTPAKPIWNRVVSLKEANWEKSNK